jgi:hypothetical protein
MKRKVFVSVLLLGVFTAVFAMTTGISGKWIGKAKIPDDELTLRYTLKSENGKLTGVAHGPQADYDILDGVVKGDSLSFHVVVENGNNILNKGKYYPDGDSISLNFILTGTTLVHVVLNRDAVGR